MSIEETLVPVAPPLRMDEGGTLRVGKTRVTLDSIVYAYRSGKRPERIARSFDTVPLADIYAVVAYYLRNRPAVDAYLEAREREEDLLRAEIERQWPPDGNRDRLVARRAAGS